MKVLSFTVKLLLQKPYRQFIIFVKKINISEVLITHRIVSHTGYIKDYSLNKIINYLSRQILHNNNKKKFIIILIILFLIYSYLYFGHLRRKY